MSVIIGVDPHNATHTAVAVDGDETELARAKARATRNQVPQLLSWAEPLGERTWAIESASGLGYLLSQQLVAAGETVLDVPATLAARIRVLSSRRSDKNDPNDALSVAVATLRTPQLRAVVTADHAEVLRLLAKRNIDLGRQRTRVVCRLHNLIAELVPGGIRKELYASQATRLLDQVAPSTPAEHARLAMARELLTDVEVLDVQLKDSHRRIRPAVAASNTSVTDIYGIGPVLACYLIGYTGDIARFANRDSFAAYNGTAPVERSSGGRACTACPSAGTASSTTRCTWLQSARSATPAPTVGSTPSAKSLRAVVQRGRLPSCNTGSSDQVTSRTTHDPTPVIHGPASTRRTPVEIGS